MKKLDNKGFTLVELLAVIVILIGIMSVAVPAISSSLGKNKENTIKKNKKLLENASEFYVSNNKEKIFDSLESDSLGCFVDLNNLVNSDYVDKNVLVDTEGNSLANEGVIFFNKNDYSFTYTKKGDIAAGITECVTGSSINAKAFEVENYVKMIPDANSFIIGSEFTGYSTGQSINPKELDLWRVTNVDSSGTTMVSVNVSTDQIYFYGLTGYINYIGALNTLATKYAKSPYTKTTRHIGYNNQTQIITDLSKFAVFDPWTCNSGDTSCNPSPVESQGGGDKITGVNPDFNISSNYPANNSERYCFASRAYKSSNEPKGYEFSWNINYINIKEGKVKATYAVLYGNKGEEGLIESSFRCAIRPIVVIYSTYMCEKGDGSLNNPCVLD